MASDSRSLGPISEFDEMARMAGSRGVRRRSGRDSGVKITEDRLFETGRTEEATASEYWMMGGVCYAKCVVGGAMEITKDRGRYVLFCLDCDEEES